MVRNTYLQESLVTWPFTEQTKVYDFPSNALLTRFTVPGMDSLLWSRLQKQSESIWFPHDSHATIATVGTLCLEAWCCGMQHPVLDKTIDSFSSPVVCTASSGTMKTRQQGSHFLLNSSSISIYPIASILCFL